MSSSRIAWTGALVGALTAASARADDRASAQQLFRDGKALMSAGKYAEACPKFASAAELSATPGVRLNLADCYEKLGRTASAWTKYNEALSLAQKAGDAAAADLARGRLGELKPRLSYLVLTVAPESAASGMQVERDGERVDPAAWGKALPVDPGEHRLNATAPGRAPWATTVNVTGTGEQVVNVPELSSASGGDGAGGSGGSPGYAGSPAGSDSSSASGSQGSETARPSGSGMFSGAGGTQRALGAAAAGLGVAGLAVGSYFGVTMLSRKSDYQKNLAPDGKTCANLDCQTASHDAVAAGNVATVAFIAGGVLLGAGAALWLTAPRASNAASSIALVPVVGPLGAGLGATGSW